MKYSNFKIATFSILMSVGAMAQKKPKNILFIGVDDLRTELNCYGKSHIVSPNIDKLAKDGVAFNNAYCNVPVCGASRASMFSGIRPNHNRSTEVEARIDKDYSGVITIPGWFKQHGYTSISNGKTIHGHGDMEQDWSEPSWHEDTNKNNPKGYINPENIEAMKLDPKKNGPSTEIATSKNAAYEYADGKIVKKTIEDINKAVSSGKPFFIASGFRKPHLPFNAPKKYWDLYQRDKLPLSLSPKMAKNAPKGATHTWGELRAYTDITKDVMVTDLGEEKTRELIHGYSASVSYVDAMIGEVINHLDKIGQRDNTIIVLWSDHGWSLGDHELWCKHSTFDVALRVPLIVSAPGYQKGQRSNSVVELVDLYPTLCDLAGIEKPAHLQGETFEPILKDVNKTQADNAAYIGWKNSDAVKTPDYLLTQWYKKEDGTVYSQMLYDHKTDKLETVNVAKNPKYLEAAKELSDKITNNLENVAK